MSHSGLKLKQNVWTRPLSPPDSSIKYWHALDWGYAAAGLPTDHSQLILGAFQILEIKSETPATVATLFAQLISHHDSKLICSKQCYKRRWCQNEIKQFLSKLYTGLYHHPGQIVMWCISINTRIWGLPVRERFSHRWGLITRIWGPQGLPPLETLLSSDSRDAIVTVESERHGSAYHWHSER